MKSIRQTSRHKWQKIRARIMARDAGLCQECKRLGSIKRGAEVDHIVPISKGGTDEDQNLQFLCRDCHEKKTIAEKGWKRRPTIGLDGWPVE